METSISKSTLVENTDKMKHSFLIACIVSLQVLLSCTNISEKKNGVTEQEETSTDFALGSDSIVYKSDKLIIQKLSKHVYLHTSFLQTTDFGNVPCNGMLVENNGETIIFDTPSDTESAAELLHYTTHELASQIRAVIPTHFHSDCVGGLEEFNVQNIPVYASDRTIALLKSKQIVYSKPIQNFTDSLMLQVGDKRVYALYFGEGHTMDNVIGYFPDDNAIFGGCLIKEVGAGEGYLGDANVKAWSATVKKIKERYPAIEIVIPGHGKVGGSELLDFTIQLFKQPTTASVD